MKPLPLVALGALLIAVTACTSSDLPTGSTTPPPSTSVPAASTPTPSLIGGNIEIAATTLPAGPFRITPLFCGHFTTAQRNTYGTNAAGGLVYRYTDDSQTLTGWASVTVNFLSGSDVVGNNVTGNNPPDISPGQSAVGEVDALNNGGQDVSFARCEVMGYGAFSATSGALPLNFAP